MTSRNSLQNASYNASAASSSSLVTPTLALLADPATRMVDAPAMDYFVIEMVHTLRASAAVASARAKKLEKEMVNAGLLPAAPLAPPAALVTKKEAQRDSLGSIASPRTSVIAKGVDAEDEALRSRLEAIGMHVGANMAERLCRDRPRFVDTLDAVKFVCKEIWVTCWDKQVDNLRTNHRGVYVLQDNAFKPILRISSFEGAADAARRAKIYAAMPAGIIKGALARIGYHGVVVPEIPNLPQCTFQVKLPKGS